jgi:hypothetical protein
LYLRTPPLNDSSVLAYSTKLRSRAKEIYYRCRLD